MPVSRGVHRGAQCQSGGGGGVTGAVTPARVVSALVPFLDSELKEQRVFSLGNDLSSILCRCCSFC